MDKSINENISYNHGISINERKTIYITGVLKIESFDDEEFLMETNMGYLVVKGEGLEIIKLDTKDGIVSIKGLIISMSYIETMGKGKKENKFFNNLFK